jgi:hypothetical protein
MDLVQDTEGAWIQAQESYLESLSPAQRRRIRGITTKEMLLETTKEYYEKYKQGGLPAQLERINPFLAQLSSFSHVVRTFVSSNPAVSGLIWGSVSFIIELCQSQSGLVVYIRVAYIRLASHPSRRDARSNG